MKTDLQLSIELQPPLCKYCHHFALLFNSNIHNKIWENTYFHTNACWPIYINTLCCGWRWWLYHEEVRRKWEPLSLISAHYSSQQKNFAGAGALHTKNQELAATRIHMRIRFQIRFSRPDSRFRNFRQCRPIRHPQGAVCFLSTS